MPDFIIGLNVGFIISFTIYEYKKEKNNEN